MARPGLRLRYLVPAAAVLVVLSVAGRVDAHAVLRASEPASGAALQASPKEVVLDFNESVQFDLGGISITDATGGEVAIGPTRHRDGADDVILATVPTLPTGVYIVGYRVVSADGHPVSGNIVFRVGAGTLDGVRASGPGADRLVGFTYGILRFAMYPAIVFTVGLWLFAVWVFRPMWRRSRRVVLGGSVVLLVASLVQFSVAVPYLGGSGLTSAFHTAQWSEVARTDLGRWLLLRAACALLLIATLVRVGRRHHGRPPGLVVAGLASAGLVATLVGDGHAAAGRWPFVAWVSTFAHILAMCLWLAGLVAIVRGLRRDDVELLTAVRSRWSRVAASSVVVIVLSGLAQAFRLLPTTHLLSSPYGRLLGAKTVLVALMLVLGNAGRRALARSAHESWPPSLRRSVAIELVIAVAVVIVTTVLVQTEPAASVFAAPVGAPPTSTTTAGTGSPRDEWTTTLHLGRRSMTITLDGATTGRHRASLVVDDAPQPFVDPISIDARLTLAAKGLGPIPVLFTSPARLHWSTDELELPVAGQWRLEVFVIDASTKARFATAIDITDPGAS